jgi:hypothetical protein
MRGERARNLTRDAPSTDAAKGNGFALSRRKQGFESPRERHPSNSTLILRSFLF